MLSLAFVFLGVFAGSASADWSDNFDSYALGSGLHGQGGWHGWDGSPGADAYVSDLYARSTPHSASVAAGSDIVHEWTEAVSGPWTMTTWQYVPTDFSGSSYFILLNQYADFGPYNWSTQVSFNSSTMTVLSDPEGATLPLITGRWVEIRVEIDLDLDTQTFYYDGTVLFSKSWTEGMSGGGSPTIAAIDLFANGASPVYYDDCSLTGIAPPIEGACCLSNGSCVVMAPGDCTGTYMGDGTDCDPNPCPPVPVQESTWGLIKNQYR